MVSPYLCISVYKIPFIFPPHQTAPLSIEHASPYCGTIIGNAALEGAAIEKWSIPAAAF
jgi:hypothetical protein